MAASRANWLIVVGRTEASPCRVHFRSRKVCRQISLAEPEECHKPRFPIQIRTSQTTTFRRSMNWETSIAGYCAELGRVIVGQHAVIERLAICLFARGHGLLDGRARPGQDAAGQQAGRNDVAEVQPHPVHARPDADGHHGHRYPAGRRRRPPRVSIRPRPGVRQHRVGRRNQPGPTKNAGRDARGDAGAQRHGRRQAVRARRAVPRAGDAKSGRAGRHLSAARGAARSVHVPDRARLSVGRRGNRDRPHDDRR